MLETIIPEAMSLGISGLLFVMWWFERQERTQTAANAERVVQYASRAAEVNEQLLDVVRANTEALAALREELRTHRVLEADWLERVSRQLEQLTDEA